MGKEALYLQRAMESCKRHADHAGRLSNTCPCCIRGPVENERLQFSPRPLKSVVGAGSNSYLTSSRAILSADSAIASHDIIGNEFFLPKSLGGSSKVVAREVDKELIRALSL